MSSADSGKVRQRGWQGGREMDWNALENSCFLEVQLEGDVDYWLVC